MQLSHTRPVASARFDDPNLVSCAGLVPMAALAHQCGLSSLADEHITVPTDKGANAYSEAQRSITQAYQQVFETIQRHGSAQGGASNNTSVGDAANAARFVGI